MFLSLSVGRHQAAGIKELSKWSYSAIARTNRQNTTSLKWHGIQ